MKEWIAKQIIAMSETTGRPVPRWIRIFISADVINEELEKERQLTESLRSGPLEDEQIPPSLVVRLDQTFSHPEALRHSAKESSRLVFPSWALAAVAVLIFSATLFLVYPRDPAANAPAVAQLEVPPESAAVELPEAPLSRPAPVLPRQSIEQDLILNPLVREQERLTSDVTNALQYMADSFLPQEYAQRVNENLIFLKVGNSGSI